MLKDMDCEYKKENCCKRAEELCGMEVKVEDIHCQICISSADPQGINRATVSLAAQKVMQQDEAKGLAFIKKFVDVLKVIPSEPQKVDFSCVNRGSEIGDVDCKCQGKNKVYTCAKHGFCSIRKMVPGIPKVILGDELTVQRPLKYCNDCDDITSQRGHSFDTVKPDYYHTIDDLILNSVKLASNIASYEQIKGVAGIPRSGLTVASAMAVHLGVPLYYIDHLDNLNPIPNGLRLSGVSPDNGKILLVDDSMNTGQRMREIRQRLGDRYYVYGAVYSTHKAKSYADYIQVLIDLPHWYEWWLYGCPLLYYQKVATDFDGIICEDCPPQYDDDGPLYTKWMMEVKPIRHFYPHGVPYAITARLEKYAKLTRWWLDRNKQVVGNVIHAPYKSKEERSRHSIAQFKAQKCKELGVEIFIESEPVQAMEIAALTDKPVICPKSRKVYNFEKGQYIFR